VSTTDAPSIAVDHVNKTYYPSPGWMKAMVRTNITEPVVALGDISLRVDPGEIVAVVGPNGAGKTTTFRILVGLTTPTKGRASVMGYDATKEAVSVRSLVGWMPGDDRSMFMRLTCSENLRFHGMLQGLKGRRLERKITDTLEIVGLGHAAEKTIFALSAGMRARIQLARALLHDPAVLILDEPTGAVDPVAAHGLLNLITEIVEERKLAAMISSHRLEEIEALHSRVILLDRGTIRYDGDLDTLRERLDRPCLEVHFAQADTAAMAAKAVDSASLAASISQDDGTVRIILEHSTPPGAVLAELGHLLPDVTQVNEIQRPLRDLLAEIYGSNGDEDNEDEDETPDAERNGDRGRRRRAKRQGQGRRQHSRG
jgi:ABC-2 type transport system ATP-binding protein